MAWTAEKIAALPIGGMFGSVEKIIAGKKVKVPVAPQVIVPWLEDDDVRGYIDSHGFHWRLGQYANGDYFRYRR